MSDDTPTIEPGPPESDPVSEPATTGASPLRLRLGVALILLWWIPIWALGPAITQALSGLPVPPSVAVVTGTIVVIQTVIGLLGFWVAGSEVKTIVQQAPKKRAALRAIWSIFIHGEIRTAETTGTEPPP